jgi:muramidase (phage lysozyme)
VVHDRMCQSQNGNVKRVVMTSFESCGTFDTTKLVGKLCATRNEDQANRITGYKTLIIGVPMYRTDMYEEHPSSCVSMEIANKVD